MNISSLSEFMENRVLGCKIQYVFMYYFPSNSFSGGSVTLLFEALEDGRTCDLVVICWENKVCCR